MNVFDLSQLLQFCPLIFSFWSLFHPDELQMQHKLKLTVIYNVSHTFLLFLCFMGSGCFCPYVTSTDDFPLLFLSLQQFKSEPTMTRPKCRRPYRRTSSLRPAAPSTWRTFTLRPWRDWKWCRRKVHNPPHTHRHHPTRRLNTLILLHSCASHFNEWEAFRANMSVTACMLRNRVWPRGCRLY